MTAAEVSAPASALKELARLGGLQSSMRLLSSKKRGVADNAALVLAAATSNDEICKQLLSLPDATGTLSKGLLSEYDQVRLNIARVISHIAGMDKPNSKVSKLLEGEVVSSLCQCLYSPSEPLVECVTLALGNLMCENAKIAVQVSECKGLERFVELMSAGMAEVGRTNAQGETPLVRPKYNNRVIGENAINTLANVSHGARFSASVHQWGGLSRAYSILRAHADIAYLDGREEQAEDEHGYASSCIREVVVCESALQLLTNITTHVKEAREDLYRLSPVTLLTSFVTCDFPELQALALLAISGITMDATHPLLRFHILTFLRRAGAVFSAPEVIARAVARGATPIAARQEAALQERNNCDLTLEGITPDVKQSRRERRALRMAAAVSRRQRLAEAAAVAAPQATAAAAAAEREKRGAGGGEAVSGDARGARAGRVMYLERNLGELRMNRLQAAVKMQSAVRMFLAQCQVLEVRVREWAATLLQSVWRMRRDKSRVQQLRMAAASASGVMLSMRGTIQGRSGWYRVPDGHIFAFDVALDMADDDENKWCILVGPITDATWTILSTLTTNSRVAVACPGTTQGQTGYYVDRQMRVTRWEVSDQKGWVRAVQQRPVSGNIARRNSLNGGMQATTPGAARSSPSASEVSSSQSGNTAGSAETASSFNGPANKSSPPRSPKSQGL